MRRAMEKRQLELDDLEDTKCRRKSYAMAQRESLPIPLPLPVYPPPKPIARPPPPKTVFRPVGPGYRANNRGYRPKTSGNPLPATPEVPSTPPVRSQHIKARPLLPTPEEPPSICELREEPRNRLVENGRAQPRPRIAKTPDASPILSDPQGRRLQEQLHHAPRIANSQTDINNVDVITQGLSSPPTPTSLPPTPPTHHLPPTPTSLSRSDTPSSPCPRTPTSIRAAPWQPQTPTVLIHRNPPPPHPSPKPGVTTAPPTAYPPTPPSSPLRPSEICDVTPSSSLSSSIEQGLSHSRLSLGSINPLPNSYSNLEEEEEEPTPAPDIASLNPSETSVRTLPDVMHLNENLKRVVSASEGDLSAAKGIGISFDLKGDSTNELISDPIRKPAFNSEVSLPAGQDHDSAKNEPQTYKAYRTRFWILIVFSAVAFFQSMVWGTFGPIAESALVAFPDWTDGTIAAFPNWGPIVTVFFTIPMMWLLQKIGLRFGMIICTVLCAIGTMIRCVTSQESAFTILCHIGSILNAFVACFTLSLPAMVAAVWFPPNERTTATAVGALGCQLGGAAMYMGPLIVQAPPQNSSDVTNEIRDDIRSNIMTLMYIHFGMAVLLLAAVLIYFPAVPPTPPSASSAKEKYDFLGGIKAIVKNVQLVLVIIVYSFSFGVPIIWIGVLTFSLLEIDIHQDDAMGVAVTAVVCSGIAAFITARITDKVYGHLKITIIVLLLASSFFFLWFVLLSTGVIPSNLAQAYISVTGGVSFQYATVPLIVELAVEIGYPIPESVIGAVLTLAFNLVGIVFLGLFQIQNIGYIWVSYVLLACVSLTIFPLSFVKETHKRFDTDKREETENTENNE